MSAPPNNPWSNAGAGGNNPQAPLPSLPLRKTGVPAWGWVLIGCGGMFFLIIPIFAAILFPVFAQARNKARAVSCMSNLKQQGVAANIYLEDNDDTYPPAAQWMDKIKPYVNDAQAYHCPSAGQRDPTIFGYAYNDALNNQKLSKVASPPTMPLTFDSTTLTANAHDALTSLPSPGRHVAGNNFSFADGHAKYKQNSATP